MQQIKSKPRSMGEVLDSIKENIKLRAEKAKETSVETKVVETLDNKKFKRVLKSNALARAHYNYTLPEKRIMEIAISKVSPYAEDIESVEISAKEYAIACDISMTEAYQQIKSSVRGLMSKVLTIKNGSRHEDFTLMSHAEYFDNSGKILCTFNSRLKTHLNELEQHFTMYPIDTPCSFKTFYTWRFYELIMSWLKINKNTKTKAKNSAEGFFILSVNDLRLVLSVPESYNYSMFNKRVLLKSLQEIVLKTPIAVSVEYKKEGKRVDQIKINFNMQK